MLEPVQRPSAHRVPQRDLTLGNAELSNLDLFPFDTCTSNSVAQTKNPKQLHKLRLILVVSQKGQGSSIQTLVGPIR